MLFKQFRPLLKIAAQLERIAGALEYFAQVDARANNRMFLPKKQGWRLNKDESELFHTDRTAIEARLASEEELMLERGYPELEAQDAINE